MLEKVRRRAQRAGVSERIRLCLSEREQLGIGQKVDFALAFWMAHEVRDRERFFHEILALLKPGGVFLLVEPRIHVPEKSFREIVATAERAGLKPCGEESIRLSRAVVFRSA
jgi:SAM-dependent methyltransferase